MSGSTDSLSRLVARFTADRDELMTRVQECQDRVADLVDRLESTECPRPAAAAPDPQMQSVELLRAEIAALEAEIAARTDTEAAWKAAILETREAIDARLVELQTEIGTTYDRFAPLEQFQTRMEVAMEQWMHDPSAAGAVDRGPETALLRERIEALAAGLTRLSDGMQDLGAMRASLAGMHRRIDEMGSGGGEAPVGMVDAIERIRADVEALRGEVSRYARPDAIAGLTEGLTEVRLAISALKNQLRSLDTAITTGLRSTTARWDSEARALAARVDDVSRLFASHAEAHRHSLQDRATEWARIAGTMVATEIQRLGKSVPSVSLPSISRFWTTPASILRKPW
jgi:chromosome segregation ATPase